MVTAANLAIATLRANPAYRALALNRLSAQDREVVASQPGVSDAFGVLMPAAGSGLAPVVVGRETALLFFSLQSAGPAPDFALADALGEGTRALKQLILDRVLEIEGARGFVSGKDALDVLGTEELAEVGALTALSYAALRCAAACAAIDMLALAQRLYGYNRRPITRRMRELLPTRAAVARHLGLVAGNIPGSAWIPAESGEEWLHFVRRGSSRMVRGIACKLYVGLAVEELPESFTQIANALSAGRATQFKIAAEPRGLMRSDKLVAYFSSKDELLAAAELLSPILAGRRAHAVPFTCEIAGGGLLSWGVDPAPDEDGVRTSWRQSICERLAAALVTARTGASEGLESWRFALERLRLDGVDPGTFLPTARW